MKLRLDKKGDVRTLPPTELIGYILVGAIFIVILLIAGIFTSIYFSENEEEFAVNNFIALANIIETLSQNDKTFDVQKAFPFYLPSDFIVVGFDKEWDDNKESDKCPPEEAVRKPTVIDGKEGEKCQNYACICLFGDNNDDFMDNDAYNVKLIECRSLPEVDYITALYLDDKKNSYGYAEEVLINFGGKKNGLPDYFNFHFNHYAFFYIYGQCDGYLFDKDIESRKLYIEKFTDNNHKTYIFIAPEYDKADIISYRYNWLNTRYTKPS